MTKIEWVKNTDGSQGRSWNPVTGCTKISPGCKNCYAERMARRLAGRYGYPETPHHFDVTLRRDRLEEPLHRKKPTTYFVCSMSDLFHPDVPTHYIAKVWNVMRQCPQHTFQVLTKRPGAMLSILLDWDVILPNVWLGVSVENPDYLWRIEELLKCTAVVRFVSLEPLLEPIDASAYMPHPDRKGLGFDDMPGRGDGITYPFTGLDWVIAGGESGPGARPMDPEWARSIRDQCVAAGVPYFHKQNGVWLHESQTTAQQKGEMHHKLRRYPSHKWSDGSYSWRVGKKYAGRLLDGREWNEMPNV